MPDQITPEQLDADLARCEKWHPELLSSPTWSEFRRYVLALRDARARIAELSASLNEERVELGQRECEVDSLRRCSTCGGDPKSHPSGKLCVCRNGTREGEVDGLQQEALYAHEQLDALAARVALLEQANTAANGIIGAEADARAQSEADLRRQLDEARALLQRWVDHNALDDCQAYWDHDVRAYLAAARRVEDSHD